MLGSTVPLIKSSHWWNKSQWTEKRKVKHVPRMKERKRDELNRNLMHTRKDTSWERRVILRPKPYFRRNWHHWFLCSCHWNQCSGYAYRSSCGEGPLSWMQSMSWILCPDGRISMLVTFTFSLSLALSLSLSSRWPLHLMSFLSHTLLSCTFTPLLSLSLSTRLFVVSWCVRTDTFSCRHGVV